MCMLSMMCLRPPTYIGDRKMCSFTFNIFQYELVSTNEWIRPKIRSQLKENYQTGPYMPIWVCHRAAYDCQLGLNEWLKFWIAENYVINSRISTIVCIKTKNVHQKWQNQNNKTATKLNENVNCDVNVRIHAFSHEYISSIRMKCFFFLFLMCPYRRYNFISMRNSFVCIHSSVLNGFKKKC